MDHDMSGMSTTGASPTPTMGGMGPATSTPAMSMGMGGGCKISMLWNWYTVDACFIARSWRVTTTGYFALSCIGVVLLVIGLEFVRRLQREYDRHIIRHAKSHGSATVVQDTGSGKLADNASASGSQPQTHALNTSSSRFVRFLRPFDIRPTLLQQAVRGLLYMTQFGAAYFVMLLAMYYNGYIIISILIGAFLGFTIFGYDNLGPAGYHQESGTSCC